MFGYSFAKRCILAADPHAFDAGTVFAAIEEGDARLANDPEIQRRKEEARKATNRENRPVLIAGLLANAALYGALTWFLPGLLTAILFVVTSAIAWMGLHLWRQKWVLPGLLTAILFVVSSGILSAAVHLWA
jgi:hypothetical protein